jgi:alpha/beta superfamily hydrolase
VGASAGVHDDGVGETADFLFLMDLLPDMAEVVAACAGAPARLSLAGFSFGSFVVACAAQARAGHPLLDPGLVLVGAAAGKWPLPAVPTQSLVVHGERDETIPLTDVLDWARPQELPVVVLPGADHFFHRRLTRLRDLVVDHGLAAEARRGMTETLDG